MVLNMSVIAISWLWVGTDVFVVKDFVLGTEVLLFRGIVEEVDSI